MVTLLGILLPPPTCTCSVLKWTLQRCSAVQCLAGDASVRLTVQQQLPFGESLRIAGSGDALGNWDPASAPGKPFSML